MISAITAKTTTFVLVFILLANNINTMVIVADFVINQDQIAKTLCVQKEDQKGCNGKCQLRKELTENNPESNPDTPIQETKRISLDVYCPASIFTLETEPIEPIVLKQSIHFSDLKVSKMYLDIDTPPPNFS
ncbi:hypothetical protein [Psychroserpens sp. NJDZ02]|uniref:hypothetical protein n=1 Tax=Psychroserpens sp. NJDZ02 TaxID=2570561 RepID=UPI0010A8E9AB|nr:hypothetical protein [Psychroserpens sp. NJDZ02]QCE40786.1 hypothetical protein E9099_04920 [Psychroserpens sp. NJDZ02]